MSDLELRIKESLEPVLELPDPRQRISAYHDMPYALFRYDPKEEFDLRKQVTLLETRLLSSYLSHRHSLTVIGDEGRVIFRIARPVGTMREGGANREG